MGVEYRSQYNDLNDSQNSSVVSVGDAHLKIGATLKNQVAHTVASSKTRSMNVRINRFDSGVSSIASNTDCNWSSPSVY